MKNDTISKMIILSLMFFLAGNLLNMFSENHIMLGMALIYVGAIISIITLVIACNQISKQNKLREKRLQQLEYEVEQLKKKIK
jgi:NADH:ubiquinone oxidoreductase subunit 6 (subunit J)